MSVPRLGIFPIPDVLLPKNSADAKAWQTVQDAVRTTRRNFLQLQQALNAALRGGHLLVDGSVLYKHLEAEIIFRLLNDVLTTRGDIIYRGVVQAERLAKGAANTLLSMGANDPAWATLSAILDTLGTPAHGMLLYRGAALWTLLGAGSAGLILHAAGAGAPVWQQADHGALGGLGDDDHTQYHNNARGDARYSLLGHAHGASDIVSGTLDGDRLPGLSATKRGGVPATGAPSGLFLKDDGTWAAGGGGASAFTGLSDTPAAYTGAAGQVVKVKGDETGLEFGSGAASPLTTKGDLFGRDTGDARIPVAANNTLLTPDSTQALGVKWATISALLDAVFSSTAGKMLQRGASAWEAVDAPIGGGADLTVFGHPWGPGAKLIFGCIQQSLTSITYTSINSATSGTVTDPADPDRAAGSRRNTTTTLVGWRANSTGAKPAYNPHAYADFKIPTGTWPGTTACLMIGLDGTTAAPAAGSTPSNDSALLYYNGDGTGNLLFKTTDGSGTTQTTDTGVAFAEGVWYDIVIYTDDQGVSWKCKINGTLVATHATNVPTTTQAMFIYAWNNRNTSSDRTMLNSYLQLLEVNP